MNTSLLAHPGRLDLPPVTAPRPRPREGEPVHSAARLPCATCGRDLHDHDGSPPDCRGFVRPALPTGYVYASALGAGVTFQFLGRSTGRTHLTQQAARLLDDENGLVELRTGAAAYLVQGTTIVRLTTRTSGRELRT